MSQIQTPQAPTQPQQPPKKRGCAGCLFKLLIGFGVLFVLILIGAGWLANLWQSKPQYWQQNRTRIAETSEAELARIAEAAESRVIAQTKLDETGDADGARRTLRVTVDEMNAWLHARLPEWQAYEGKSMPPGVSDPMVAIENGQLVAAFEVDKPELKQVVSIWFELELLPGGRMRGKIMKVLAGNFPLPIAGVIKGITDQEPDTEKARVLRGLVDGYEFDPVIELPEDARKFRIVEFTLDEDAVELTLEVERADE